METLGYIYAVIYYALRKKISVEIALEIIRKKLLEQDKGMTQGQLSLHKNKKEA